MRADAVRADAVRADAVRAGLVRADSVREGRFVALDGRFFAWVLALPGMASRFTVCTPNVKHGNRSAAPDTSGSTDR